MDDWWALLDLELLELKLMLRIFRESLVNRHPAILAAIICWKGALVILGTFVWHFQPFILDT
jgi:hypothetical protein